MNPTESSNPSLVLVFRTLCELEELLASLRPEGKHGSMTRLMNRSSVPLEASTCENIDEEAQSSDEEEQMHSVSPFDAKSVRVSNATVRGRVTSQSMS